MEFKTKSEEIHRFMSDRAAFEEAERKRKEAEGEDKSDR
jgi:hypothetical protein